jgi:hypothetical protein
VRKNLVPIRKLHTKHRVRKRFSYGAFDFDRTIFTSQALPSSLIQLIDVDEHGATTYKFWKLFKT